MYPMIATTVVVEAEPCDTKLVRTDCPDEETESAVFDTRYPLLYGYPEKRAWGCAVRAVSSQNAARAHLGFSPALAIFCRAKQNAYPYA